MKIQVDSKCINVESTLSYRHSDALLYVRSLTDVKKTGIFSPQFCVSLHTDLNHYTSSNAIQSIDCVIHVALRNVLGQ